MPSKKPAKVVKKVDKKGINHQLPAAKMYAAKVWRWCQNSRWAQLGFYWLIGWMVLASFFFSEVLKNNNYLELFPVRMVFPLVMHWFTALIIAIVVWLLPKPRSVGAKTVTLLFLTLSMVNYNDRLTGVAGIFRSVLPILPKPDSDLPIISILFLLVLLGLAAFAGTLVEKLYNRYEAANSKNIVGGVAILTGFLFLGQAIPTAKIIVQVLPESKHQATTELNQAAAMHPVSNPDKPDIYYIVLEDHLSNSVLKSQFGYDNSSFMDYLRQQGFSVDENAKSPYPSTPLSVSSVFNMSYHNNDLRQFKDKPIQSSTLFFNMNQQAEAVKLLKQQGYVYDFLGNPSGGMSSAPLADSIYTSVDRSLNIFGKTKNLRTLESADFTESPYYQFAKVPYRWWPVKLTETDPVSLIRNQLTALDQIATSKQQGGRLIFSDILAPHIPSYFNADCSMSAHPTVDNIGAPVKQKYAGEVQCVDSQIKKVINDININSKGKAIILLVSDEGQAPSNMDQTILSSSSADEQSEGGEENFDGSMAAWSTKDLQMKFGTLEAVSIPAAEQSDLQHMAPVNAFRIVLDRYFGYSFNYLPNCQLALSGGSQHPYEYRYTDVTKRLGGSDAGSCKQYE